jgi:hypothetical protein
MSSTVEVGGNFKIENDNLILPLFKPEPVPLHRREHFSRFKEAAVNVGVTVKWTRWRISPEVGGRQFLRFVNEGIIPQARVDQIYGEIRAQSGAPKFGPPKPPGSGAPGALLGDGAGSGQDSSPGPSPDPKQNTNAATGTGKEGGGGENASSETVTSTETNKKPDKPKKQLTEKELLRKNEKKRKARKRSTGEGGERES